MLILPRRRDRSRSPFTFIVRTLGGEEMRINAKVFSLEAVRELGNLGNVRAEPEESEGVEPA